MPTKSISLTLKESSRKELVLKCINGELSTKDAAIISALSQRRIQQLVEGFKKIGDKIFIHGNKNKKRNSPKEQERTNKIISIFTNTKVNNKNPFFDMNYKYFSELLFDEYEIKVSPPHVKKILNSIGYYSPIYHRCKTLDDYHLIRERKEHFGELVQGDGKQMDIFHNGHIYCIQGFVDDATGYPVGLYITKNECLLGYIEATRNMLTRFGIPQQLYPDKAQVFFVNNKKNDDGEKHLTQFGIIMEELGVDMFPAHSPQAKGRIERFWETIQWRLTQLLALRGIDTVEDANNFLRDKFFDIYKKWFPKEPKSDESYFSKSDDINKINYLLKATYPAKVNLGGVFSFMGYQFLCKELPNERICININEKDGMWVTKINNPKIKYSVQLVETDTSGNMPEVFKNLIERIFLKNAKPKFKEVYIDVDDIIYSQIKPDKKKTA